MPTCHLPREYYLQRAVTCYEHAGDLAAAAQLLAAFGTPAASADAARRFVALGDNAAAGAAYLAAGQPRAALACFQRAWLPEQIRACLHALGDDATTGALLLDLGQPSEAAPYLERALTTCIAASPAPPAQLATLHLHLARALAERNTDAAAEHYRAGVALLPKLPATPASADAWAALGAWGAAIGRQDRMQEGYAQALRLLAPDGDGERWHEVALAYRRAARAAGNRRLTQILDAQLAEWADAPPARSPDPAQVLIVAARWNEAFAELEPRARSGDETAKHLAVAIVEGMNPPVADADAPSRTYAPLQLRRAAAGLLGELGDPRLLDPRAGNSAVGNYWCAIDAGPFWYGDDHNERLRQMTLAYTYRIGRYLVTNAEYRHFVEAGGYGERQWWTKYGWQVKGNHTQPRYWDDERYSQPSQPVVGVTWYEAAAYGAWLTGQGHAAGWLAANEEIRLPTSLEWERAARHIDRRRYPWGDAAPNAELANYGRAIGKPTPVGCFPAGVAVCGVLDMAGNVVEWLATAEATPQAWEPQRDFTNGASVLAKSGGYSGDLERMSCGARLSVDPVDGNFDLGFRVIWSRALS